MWLGRKPSFAIACSTRVRVHGAMWFPSLMKRETVWWDTWANRATSRMVTRFPEGGSAIIVLPSCDRSHRSKGPEGCQRRRRLDRWRARVDRARSVSQTGPPRVRAIDRVLDL